MTDAPPPPDSSDVWLFYVVDRLHRAMRRGLDDLLADEGLSVPELTALLVLGEGTPLPNIRLSQRTFVSPQAGHKVATALAERGLIAWAEDPVDRRLRVARLTPEGREVLDRCTAAIAVFEDRVLAALDADARARLRADLATAARTIRGGWFGDEEEERLSAERRRRAISST